MTHKVILKKIEQKIDEINNYGVKRIGLFGSYAKGQQSESSDIDILVEFKEGEKNFDNYMDLKFFLEYLLGRKVDLVIAENIKYEIKDSIIRSVIYAKGA